MRTAVAEKRGGRISPSQVMNEERIVAARAANQKLTRAHDCKGGVAECRRGRRGSLNR